MNLLLRFAMTLPRTLQSTASLSQWISGSLKNQKYNYTVAGKKTKIVTDIKDALSGIKSGKNKIISQNELKLRCKSFEIISKL